MAHYTLLCEWCGKEMTAGHASKRACSEVCRYKLHNKKRWIGGFPTVEIPPDKKQCISCRKLKEFGDFNANCAAKDRLTSYCKSCISTEGKKARSAKPKRPRKETPKAGDSHRSLPVGTRRQHRRYVLVKVGHDKSAHHRADKNGWVAEHIIVAEKKYGIKITREFTVHHKNRNPSDNRPENLDLRVGQHGVGGDVMDALLENDELREIAVSALERYGYRIQPPLILRNEVA